MLSQLNCIVTSSHVHFGSFGKACVFEKLHIVDIKGCINCRVAFSKFIDPILISHVLL